MRSLPFLFLYFPFILIGQNKPYFPKGVRAMSFNIRYNTDRDGENAWPLRKEIVANTIHFHKADLVGVQEALHDQIMDLKGLLPSYDFVGVGRDDGKEKGEYSAIWYKKSRFEVRDKGNFWLSKSPEKPSKGWDANIKRICSWAKFYDRSSQNEFYHFNTHFDHQGEIARRESAKLILQKLALINLQKLPVVLTGDFNATPESEPYQILTQSETAVLDSKIKSIQTPHGPDGTWSGFKEAGAPGRRIDYVFVQNQVSVLSYAALSDSYSGRFPSDHLPVLAEVLIAPPTPLPFAHAHNDYEHTRPLMDALSHGFSSIEVDVHLINETVYVSHNRPVELKKTPTFEELYLLPLAKHIDHYGTIYPGYEGEVYLMIDIKTQAEKTCIALNELLVKYDFLWDSFEGVRIKKGPFRLFISGNRPKEWIMKQSPRYMSIDGRPDDLGKGYSPEIMPVISQNFFKLVKWSGRGEIPKEKLEPIKVLVKKAHAEGKKVRLWASPERQDVWETLREMNVDFINSDELLHLKRYFLNQEKSN